MDADRPAEPSEPRARGNDPDAVEGQDGGERGSEESAPRRVGEAHEERETTGAGVSEAEHDFFEGAPTKNLPPMPFRDMPQPQSLGKILGPSVILAGLGVGSGEYIIWPFIVSNLGIGILWAAVVGVTLQYFLNMEIERYTLATGETAVSGFSRFWKPWGIVFCFGAVIPNAFPGWATGGVTILTFLTPLGEGSIPYVTIAVLIALGIALTVSPVVYQTLEKAEFFKVGLSIVFLVIAIVAVLVPRAGELNAMSQMVTTFGQIPTSAVVPISVILGGLVFAGAGGANNLVQSNYIRDKGLGMGAYIPKIVSPITGEPMAEPATGSMVRQDEENIRRYKAWYKVCSTEQLVSFWAICIFAIVTFSLVAYTTVYGRDLAEAADFTFIQAEGEALKNIVGNWFGTFFWIFGTLSLLLVAIGVVDYVARLVADALKTIHLTNNENWSESRIYFTVVWTMIALGTAILLAGLEAPLVLLVISSCLGGGVMFVYAVLLFQLNRRALPDAIKVSGFRLVMLIVSILFYGFFVGWLIIAQVQGLFAA